MGTHCSHSLNNIKPCWSWLIKITQSPNGFRVQSMRKTIGPNHSGTNPSSVYNMIFCVGQPPPKLHLQWLFLQRHTSIDDTIHNCGKILAFLFDLWVRFFDTQTDHNILWTESWLDSNIQLSSAFTTIVSRQQLSVHVHHRKKNRISVFSS